MANDNQFSIEIKLEDGSYRKALLQLEKDSKKSGEEVGNNLEDGFKKGASAGTNLLSIGKQLIAIAGAYLSIRQVFSGIQDAIKSEQSVQQLNLALAQNGNFVRSSANEFQNFVNGLERTTAVSDDVINNGAALLASLGKLNTEALKPATQAALDLAAGLQIDVSQAFTILSKASTGQTDALSRYGIKVKESADASETFSRVLDRINSQFGGMAESRLNTFGGSIDKLRVSFDNFFKEIGFAFTESSLLRKGIQSIAGLFDSLGENIKGLSSSRNVIDSLILGMLDFARVISQTVLPTGELLFNAFNIVFQQIRLGLQTLLTGVVTGLDTTIGAIARAVPGLQGVGQAITDIAGASQQTLLEFTTATNEASNNLFNFDFTAKSEEFIAGYQQTAATIVSTSQMTTDSIKNNTAIAAQESLTWLQALEIGWRSFNQTTQQVATAFAGTIRNGIVNSLSGGFAAMGKALVTGENLFKAFGAAILASFGQVLIQLGTQTLAVGLLMQGVPILFGLQGGAAIAAGIGMIIAGGALTALGQAAGGAPAGAGGAGGGAGGTAPGGIAASPFGEVGSFAQQEQSRPGSQVVVNVQGNILDRRQSGLELAEIIREGFDQNGVTTVGAV